MASKKRTADDDGVEWMTSSGGGGNRPLPRVSVLQRGLVLSVYPDKATLETMREENWTTVTVGFKKNEAGEITELLLRKGRTDPDQVRLCRTCDTLSRRCGGDIW
jgi:hypothetical protein